MAGFILKNLDNKGFVANIQRNIRYLSSLGTKWDSKLIKQSKSIGIGESQMDSMYNTYYQGNNYAGTDYGQKEFIAFFDQSYPTRRDFLRKFAMNGEIEHVLEVISDECIIYDESNYFAYPNTTSLKSVLKEDKAKEIVDDLNESYRKVYFAFRFNEGHDAWHYIKKFLIDGFLAFEIIYDENEDDDAKNIIGFKELDPVSLEPEIRIDDEDGKEYRVWIQYRGDANKQRELVDGNLIYISWARGNFISRLSYVERLVRSFNMLRTLENSRIIWNVWNSQYRMKIVVPIGSQSETKARTRLSELRGMYKEDLNIDYHSGEVTFNGSPNFSFAKTYVIPSKEGVQTEIDSFKPDGYDLSTTESLQYFWNRFIIETKIPQSRFSSQSGESSDTWSSSVDSITREELRFSNFINRIRSIFQEILLKPTWIQFCLKHPQFSNDQSLKSAIGLEFIEENLFKIAKERDIAEKGAQTISTLMGILQKTVLPDGTIGEESYFDPEFLVDKYLELTENEIKLNNKYRNEKNNAIIKLKKAYDRLLSAKGEESGGGSSDFDGGFGAGSDIGGGSDNKEFGGFDEIGNEETTSDVETPDEGNEIEI